MQPDAPNPQTPAEVPAQPMVPPVQTLPELPTQSQQVDLPNVTLPPETQATRASVAGLPELPSSMTSVTATKPKSKKGLIIALVIILILLFVGVLGGLLLVTQNGVNNVQLVLGDNMRRDHIKAIVAALNTIYANSEAGTYPETVTTSADYTAIYVGDQTITNGGHALLNSAATSDSNGTRYCYARINNNYELGAKLSDGTWFNLGTSVAQTCDDSSQPLAVGSPSTAAGGPNTQTQTNQNPTGSDTTPSTDSPLAQAQAGLRLVQRKDALQSIAVALNSHYSSAGSYPTSLSMQNSGASVKIDDTNTITFNGVAKAGSETDTTQSRYCYSLVADGYKLGVKQEDGTWYNLGSSAQLCSDTDAAVQ